MITIRHRTSRDVVLLQLPRDTLRRANLAHAFLLGADLSERDCAGADLTGAMLKRANLAGACLRAALLCGADLQHADLTNADLRGADLRGALVQGTHLLGALYDGSTRWPSGFCATTAGCLRGTEPARRSGLGAPLRTAGRRAGQSGKTVNQGVSMGPEEGTMLWNSPKENREAARRLREQARELCSAADRLRQRARDKVQVVLFARYLRHGNGSRS
jgi:uncharacterized protein YjbI with pentapeptide repeats